MENDSYFFNSSIINADYFLDSSKNKIFFIDCVYGSTPPSIIECASNVDADVQPHKPSIALCDIKSAEMSIVSLTKIDANHDRFFVLSKLQKPDQVEFLLTDWRVKPRPLGRGSSQI